MDTLIVRMRAHQRLLSMANTSGNISSLETTTLGFAGYRPNNASLQSTSSAPHVGATSAFGPSPYLTGHFANGYQPTPDFQNYVANGPPTAGWYGAHDPRLSKLNFYATFQ
ncbi:unnamed protein product [Dracunculus medinensis]|uniref:OAR domain-containing protein n=1 Tax=Dracunculus medinensis TaxID=318479 RepID=A0A0N4U4P2_DRAME|nr:unnamed protein product [Dracunculus medinensis]